MSQALVLRSTTDIERYMGEISRHPLLSREQELKIANRLVNENDIEAAHQLVVSNLRFVVKVAHEYKGYGLQLIDLIQEGNIGLMMAVKKFDPAKGYRLISYAVWWIRAYIREYITRSWSLVKIGSSGAQRKLFFKLRSTRSKIEQTSETNATSEAIAKELGVKEKDVVSMEMRLASRDFSLDNTLDDGARATHLDMLADDVQDSPEALVAEAEERKLLSAHVGEAMSELSDKERYIVEEHLLSEDPRTLQDIGNEFSVSRERIRQIESRAIKKLRGSIEKQQIEKIQIPAFVAG